MSNDNQQLATLMGQGANLPAFVQGGRGAELNKEATAGTGGESINRISMKQSRFRLIVGGEQVRVFDEPYMDVVVVQTNPNISKAYYSKKYDPNADDQSPDCYSSNGIVPDGSVTSPVCDNCANCPMNAWGSKISDTGSKVKACSDTKRLAIVPAANVEAPMFQVAIPAGSLKTWGNYVRMLNQATPAIPYNGVVTRMKFDPDSDFPKLMFEPTGWVSEEQYAAVQARYGSDEALHICTIVDTPVAAGGATVANTADAAQAQAAAEAAAKAEAEAKARAEAEAKARAEAAAKAQAEAEAAAKAEAAKEVAAAAWGEPTQQAAPTQQNEAFEASGWDTPAATAKDPKEPPAQQHVEQAATVATTAQSIDDIFGAGFDD